ncbi:MAG: hypothetical protein WCS27_13005 [Victivallaceae bacterium]|jgi:hypothetical protein
MQDYHEKKIKKAIDLLKTSVLLLFAIIIAFLLITLLEFFNLDWFFCE